MNLSGPLDGITVLSLEQAVAAPFATRQLGDLGARVIKVERPDVGDFAREYDTAVAGLASYFVWLNRGKESLTLDLKDAGDRELCLRIVDHADVVIQNLAPGAAERLGLGAATLRLNRPRLITCAISGFGPGGPDSSRKAYDLLIQAEAGLLAVTGTHDTPAKVGISIADIATGMYAFTGILTALYERERTGLGSSIEVSMLEALGEWMAQPVHWVTGSGRDFVRTGARHASIAPYGPFRVANGESIFVAVQNDREWAALCLDVLSMPNLANDQRFVRNTDRVTHVDELTAIIEQAFDTLKAEDAVRLLDDAGIANAKLRTAAEFADHPQLRARDRWRMVDTPNGQINALLPPTVFEGREAVMGPVPALGAHTFALRAEFGIAPSQLG